MVKKAEAHTHTHTLNTCNQSSELQLRGKQCNKLVMTNLQLCAFLTLNTSCCTCLSVPFSTSSFGSQCISMYCTCKMKNTFWQSAFLCMYSLVQQDWPSTIRTYDIVRMHKYLLQRAARAAVATMHMHTVKVNGTDRTTRRLQLELQCERASCTHSQG